MDKVLFLTGGTGFIGANLISDILAHQPGVRIIALVRASSQFEAEDRLANAVFAMAPSALKSRFAEQVSVVRGDVALPNLGLSPHDFERVVSQTTHIIHSAANINFEAPLPDARRVNVEGTAHVLALARVAKELGQLTRVGYIGTAYVSGLKTGVIGENELDGDAGFTNAYEQSKHEAERLVREAMNDLPIIIFRPSIVVGHSESGVTTSFNVLYPPLRMIHRKRVIALPGFRNVTLDVVPIDYVTRAIVHLLFEVSTAVGQTYHLTAGKQGACTAGEIVDMAVDFFNRGSRGAFSRVRFIPPFLFSALLRFLRDLRRHASRLVDVYQPYLAVHRSFDTTNSTRDLAAAGIMPPPLPAYLDRILQYSVDSNWGKRPTRMAS